MLRMMLMVAIVTVGLIEMQRTDSRFVYLSIGSALAMATWLWGRKVQWVSIFVMSWIPGLVFLFAFVIRGYEVGARHVTYFFGTLGTLFVLDGGLSLLRYLRANPQPKRMEP